MEIRNLKTFRAVAETLSFHRAAEVLHYAQSTVSAQILALEEELGIRLFDRLGRRILLTESGGRLLNYARKMIELEEEARAEVAVNEQARGALVVRVPETLAVWRLPAVVRRFKELRPRVSLELITCAHEGLGGDLRKGVTDLAFLFADSLQVADLEMEVLGVVNLVLAASPDHPLAGKERVRTVDLAGETLLFSKVDCSYRRLLQRLLVEEGVTPGVVHEFYSMAAIMEFAAAGIGVTVMPEEALGAVRKSGRLVILPWEEALETAMLMVWHRDKWLSPGLQVFMETVREVMK